jgi:RNA polymerase sigma-70 factor, ECF subfamily
MEDLVVTNRVYCTYIVMTHKEAITRKTLTAAKEGDRVAEVQLMSELYQPVYHFLRKRTGSSDDTDELCQTVFLKVYEQLDRFDESKAALRTWVFTIARNTLIDHYRRKQSVSLVDESELVDGDLAAFPETTALAREQEVYLAGLLAQLSSESADVVTLRAIDEMPYEIIAEIIGKTPEATRQIYSRALQSLKSFVQKSPIET